MKKKALTWIWISLVVLLAGAGMGYTYLRGKAQSATNTTMGSTMQTATVRRGSLVVSASGSGTLAAGQEANLSFPTAGTLAAVNVAVGDRVSEGEVLAQLADLSTLEAAITTATLNLRVAEKALDDLMINAPAELANAQLALVEAQKTYENAQAALVRKGWTRCDSETLNAYLDQYLRLNRRLKKMPDAAADSEFYLQQILPLKNAVDSALANYTYCLGYTEYEINLSEAELSVAQVALEHAQVTVDTLAANNGIDPIALAQAQNAVALAKLNLETAEKNLAGATMIAPFDGTVLSVGGKVGDKVGNETFITLIDLQHPWVEFSVDETEMDKVAVGETAEIVFDALPDQTFTGTVIRINPTLVSTQGYQVLTGIIALDLASGGNPEQTLLAGLNAAVEIIAGKAENALLVPVEAVHDLGDGTYGVFVVNETGEPRLRMVEVGLRDETYAVITSGLEMGEVVSTGIMETN